MEYLLGVFYMVVTGAVLVSMAALYLLGPDKRYKKMYLGFQATVAVWCASQIFVLIASSINEVVVSYAIGNFGICMIGAAWFYFACEYTGKKRSMFHFLPLCAAVFHYLMVISNPLHHMYYRIFDLNHVEHGIFFYTNVATTYLFVINGAVILFLNVEGASVDKEKSTDENKNVTRGQLLIIASVLIPLFLNAVYLSGLVNAAFDITPLGFGISVILVMFATMKYHFMDFEKELAITNEKLLLEKERNRIAQQVHDTAGHTLTMIQSYMKLAQFSNDKGDNKETGTYLEEARTLTSQGIKELREAINEMKQEATYELVTQGIMQLAGQVKEIPVEVTVQGEDGKRYSHLSKVLYDSTRESITNTLKYANATKMDIVVRFKTDAIDLTISDDGCGCENIKDNNGLAGIRKRVSDAGGTVRFISGKDEGFLTRIHLKV
ncbi:MAG: hypothetical protein K6G76_01435 [Lachnospiraceae bacterium]|nr:hypothetical protein [Lachnospiraceae bacterium]